MEFASLTLNEVFNLQIIITDQSTSTTSTTAEKMELETARPMVMSGLLHEPVPGTGFHWKDTGSHCFHSQTDTAKMNKSEIVHSSHVHQRENHVAVPAFSRPIKAANANFGTQKLNIIVEMRTKFQYIARDCYAGGILSMLFPRP